MNLLEIAGVIGILSWVCSGLVFFVALKKAPYLPDSEE